ncbi:hypothetical protein BIW11_08166 [Tropilaelaps mercedesae]|uniref:DAZ-associated protein 2 n=1 Tax=Tropilaelaps mercedesae TaxID=418985 RepID=A0A1V9XR56_9ACAR|nr:hypothetical protein BIW11_08166 [Tropilaelaps mercedesae]
MSGSEKTHPYPGPDPSAPPVDAPPPYYHPSYPQASVAVPSATAGAPMMYPSIPGATAAPGQVVMHGHKMPPNYVPPAGHNVAQPYYPAGPSQMYVPVPYPQAVPQPMYPAQGYPQPGPPPPYGGPVATMAMPIAPQQQQHLVVGAQFDAGARFNHITRLSIPPPPPGCMPNAAQMAMMSGHPTTVVAEQKKGGLFKGSGSGGIKFW